MSTLPAAELHSSSDAALTELYERHAERIFAFCRRRLRSRQEAEDAVQETFVSAMRAIKRGSVPVCESAWLFKIAENVCFAVYRSGARRHVRDLTDSERLGRLAARDRDGETLIGLDAALEALPRNQRHAFVLRELRGLSYKEIAIELGVSVASVETLIYRARRGLARGIETGAGFGRRLSASLNAGSILAAVKGWFAGATAVKVASAATVAALGSLSVAEMSAQPPQQARVAPVAAVRPAAVNQSVLWGGSPRLSRKRPKAALRRSPTESWRPGPRPQPRPRPSSPAVVMPASPVAQAPASGDAPPPVETDARGSAPAPPAAPAPEEPGAAPQPPPPPLPAVEPTEVGIPDVTKVADDVPGAPPLPEVPNPADLVPEAPPLPGVPPLPEVPKLP